MMFGRCLICGGVDPHIGPCIPLEEQASNFNAAEVQKAPDERERGKPIAPLVIADIESRVAFGKNKYGQRLRANNGRDALLDAYQEALDLVMYLRQEIEERDATTIHTESKS